MNKHAQALGRLGGRIKSEAKARAARENGKKGGRRPRTTIVKIAESAFHPYNPQYRNSSNSLAQSNIL